MKLNPAKSHRAYAGPVCPLLLSLLMSMMLSACGDVGGSTPGAPDAPLDGSPAVDAPVLRCNPALPFGEPTAIEELNSSGDDIQPALSPDELTAYFSSSRPGGLGAMDLYVATRSATSSSFSAPALVNGVNSEARESRAIVTADGLTLYAEVRRGNDPYHIERAVRASTRDSFGPLAAVAELNSAAFDVAPFVLPDHSAIYLLSSRNGAYRLFRAARNGDVFSMPALVSGIDLQGFVLDYPMLSADELTIMFPGASAAGDRDIYVATRASLAEGFGKPVAVSELNTSVDEFPSWLSSDGCVLYFTRSVAAKGYDVFVARRPR